MGPSRSHSGFEELFQRDGVVVVLVARSEPERHHLVVPCHVAKDGNDIRPAPDLIEVPEAEFVPLHGILANHVRSSVLAPASFVLRSTCARFLERARRLSRSTRRRYPFAGSAGADTDGPADHRTEYCD